MMREADMGIFDKWRARCKQSGTDREPLDITGRKWKADAGPLGILQTGVNLLKSERSQEQAALVACFVSSGW
jgi:hypothetical protein